MILVEKFNTSSFKENCRYIPIWASFTLGFTPKFHFFICWPIILGNSRNKTSRLDTHWGDLWRWRGFTWNSGAIHRPKGSPPDALERSTVSSFARCRTKTPAEWNRRRATTNSPTRPVRRPSVDLRDVRRSTFSFSVSHRGPFSGQGRAHPSTKASRCHCHFIPPRKSWTHWPLPRKKTNLNRRKRTLSNQG